MISIVALLVAALSLALHSDLLTRVSLDYRTPEAAIKTMAKLKQDGSFSDLKRARELLQNEDQVSWEDIDPEKLKIEYTLEIKEAGEGGTIGGALCFIKYTKDDGVVSHVVVFLKKNPRGLFEPSFMTSEVSREYGAMIMEWQKDGTLK